jgi:hypothetical protein
MLYINNQHITKFEEWDNSKDYKQIKKNLKTKQDSFTLLNHIILTTPCFGEWNIIKDKKLPQTYLDYLANPTSLDKARNQLKALAIFSTHK